MLHMILKFILKISRAVLLFFYFVWEMILANIRVAICVVSPLSRMSPGIVAIRLDARTDTEITVLANMITLTPGTLSVDVSDDRKVLYVHTLFARDPRAVRSQIKKSFESRILGVTR